MKFSLLIASFFVASVQGKRNLQNGITISRLIDQGSEESEAGKIYSDSSDIEMTFDDYNEQGNQKIGLRFTDISIPMGAPILSANLIFIADDDDQDDSPRLQITCEAQDNSGALTENNFDISSRVKTQRDIEWANIAPWSKGLTYTSPDIGPVVQEVISREGWSSGNALTILINKYNGDTSETVRSAESENIRLNIVYGTGPPVFVPTASPTPPTNKPTKNPTRAPTKKPTQSPIVPTPYPTQFPTARPTMGVYLVQEDSEEGETGEVWDSSSDLEMCYDAKHEDEGNLRIALRFTDVNVPYKAEVHSARLIFTADESSDDEAPRLRIYGEDEGYSDRLSEDSNDISDRDKTSSSRSWTPDRWKSGREYESPDLSEIVEEIVRNKKWDEGNPMTFIIELADGYGGSIDKRTRVAEAGSTRLEIDFKEYEDRAQPEATTPTTVTPSSSMPYVIGGASAGVVAIFATSLFVYKRRKAAAREQQDTKVVAQELPQI